jgi:hypothetical protein
MATATDMVWVELSRERTKRGEITFGISGKPKESRGLIANGDPHWAQAVQALDAAPLPVVQGKGQASGTPAVITLIPREAVMKYQAAFTAAGERKRR